MCCTGPSQSLSFADFGLFPEMQGTGTKKRKVLGFGKVDLALKSQIYFEGFAFLQTIVS